MSGNTVSGATIKEAITTGIAKDIAKNYPGVNVSYIRKALVILENQFGTDGILYPKEDNTNAK